MGRLAQFMDCLGPGGGTGRKRIFRFTLVCAACTFAFLLLVHWRGTSGPNTRQPYQPVERKLMRPEKIEGQLSRLNILPSKAEKMSGFKGKVRTNREQLAIIQERVARVREQCALMGKPKRDVALHPPDTLIVNEKHRIIYCNVPKVGCTNWKIVLLKLGGFDKIDVRHMGANAKGRIYLDYIHKYTNISQRRFMLENYTKFMFVRHPFTRILSAFRNKLAPNSSYHFRVHDETFRWVSSYGKRIIEKYRGETEAKRVSSNYDNEYDLTFSEFIRFLVDPETDSFNKHWSEIHSLCLPCDLDYDVIGKYETIHEDAEYILRLAKVDPSVTFPTPSPAIVTNSSDPKMAEEYYRQVSNTLLYQLTELYSTDFELFGYHPNQFLNLRERKYR